jgi:hypothetical protein
MISAGRRPVPSATMPTAAMTAARRWSASRLKNAFSSLAAARSTELASTVACASFCDSTRAARAAAAETRRATAVSMAASRSQSAGCDSISASAAAAAARRVSPAASDSRASASVALCAAIVAPRSSPSASASGAGHHSTALPAASSVSRSSPAAVSDARAALTAGCDATLLRFSQILTALNGRHCARKYSSTPCSSSPLLPFLDDLAAARAFLAGAAVPPSKSSASCSSSPLLPFLDDLAAARAFLAGAAVPPSKSSALLAFLPGAHFLAAGLLLDDASSSDAARFLPLPALAEAELA